MLLRENVGFIGIDSAVMCKVEHFVASKANVCKAKREPIVMSLPKGPWRELSIGFCGPLLQGDYVLVVIDDYSRFIEIHVVP